MSRLDPAQSSRKEPHPFRRGANYRARSTQRGVALITAVLVVALATILAVDVAFKGYLDQRRSASLFVMDQGFELALGAEALAADVLQDDAKNSKTDYAAENWGMPVNLPIDGGELQGYLEDMQGRFNINNLLNADGTANTLAIRQFQRLLELLNMDPKWATLILDWIDADTVPSFPDGAEDTIYSAEMPPYLAANLPVTRTSELLSLVGFGLENYQKLEPYIAALPIGTALNVCTAPGAVLDSLTLNLTQFSNDPDTLAKQRQSQCFPTTQELDTAFGADAEYKKIRTGTDSTLGLGETTSYFRANISVTMGTTEFTMYSLLNRSSTGKVRAVLRSFGTP